MGTCLMCHRKIRDGRKFCDNCKQKRKNKADESYLDSLLNSVGINQTSKKVSAPEYNEFEDKSELDNTGYYDENNTYEAVTNETASDSNSVDDTFDPNGTVSDTANGEMDDMLSDLLGEMDSAGVEEEHPENDIQEEDIESIFDEAEAYAELLNNNGNNENNVDTNGNIGDGSVNAADNAADTNQPENLEDLSFIDLEWNNNSSQYDGESGYAADTDSYSGENHSDDAELDEILLNEGIQGENVTSNSVQDVFSDFDPLSEDVDIDEKKPKKKRLSWFKRLFGNVNDEVTPEMIEADRIKKEEEAEKEKQKKAEKKKKDEEKKAAAQAEKDRKKAEADAERNRKLALAIEKKNAAKEKQRKKKEQALALAEYEVEHGKINKAGATILFVIFAVLTIVIIIGTNIYSYNLSIENAQKDFDVQKYNEAYYEVYGLKIQDEDIELYDKIMTVMYVNHQLNSYEYYMTSNNREKALDSLLKGLQRYDKYLQLARTLGIKDDLDYVKGNILEKLQTEFQLTEQEAYKMVSIDDSVDYSEYLYGLLGSYPEELEKYKN